MIKSITTTLTNNLTFSLIWTNCINTKTKNYTPNFTQKYFFHLFSLLRSTQKLWLGLAQISNPDFQRICRKPNVNLITFFTYNELNVWLTLGPLRSPSGQQFDISRSYSSSYTQKQSRIWENAYQNKLRIQTLSFLHIGKRLFNYLGLH